MSEAATDRGRRRFIAALGVGQIVCWGTLYYSFPLMAEPMAQEFALSKTEVYGALGVGLAAAGLAAYPVGAAIDRGHGRAVMAGGAVFAALLLAVWGTCVVGIWSLYALFVGVGLAQAMTMYEPAFAVVARRFGADARAGVTALTLWGGFAGTVFIPLIQLLLDHVGRRDALLTLAGLVLLFAAVPFYRVIDAGADAPRPASAQGAGPDAGPQDNIVGRALRRPVFWGLAVAFTVYYGLFSGLSFHLYPMLLERGCDAATVVAVLAIIGPSQVLGRLAIWLAAARRSIRVIGSVTVAVFSLSLLLLWSASPDFAALAVFAVVYGAANGIMTIVRGMAVPEMLTRRAYGAINGLLAVPSIIAKAVAPPAAAWLWSVAGSYDGAAPLALAISLLAVAGFWFAALRRDGPL
jgi:MFS family permease